MVLHHTSSIYLLILSLAVAGCSRSGSGDTEKALAEAALKKAEAEAAKAQAEAETAQAEAAAAKERLNAEIARLKSPQNSIPSAPVSDAPAAAPAEPAVATEDITRTLELNHWKPSSDFLKHYKAAKTRNWAPPDFDLTTTPPEATAAQSEVTDEQTVPVEVITALYHQHFPDAQEGNMNQYMAYVEGFYAGLRGEPKLEAPPPAPPGSDPLEQLFSGPPIWEWGGWEDGVAYRAGRAKDGDPVKPATP